jgi:hypothetical protein
MQIAFRCLIVLFTVTFLPTSSFAADNDITVTDATVRALPPGIKKTVAYMTIKNSGAADRKLIKANSPVAKSVELHNNTNDNGVMKMRQVQEIVVKANAQAKLTAGSYHLMLIDLKQTLKEGETVSITLTFDDGSAKTIEVPVTKLQAMMEMDKGMDHSKMKN